MNMVGIIYFSGTGNTKFVAENIKKFIEESGSRAELINIEKDIIDIKKNNYDNLIIGGPVYVERYPEILLQYIEKYLKEYSRKCMFFTTQAIDKPTAAFQHAVNRLKFLNITYCEYIPMPNNFFNFMFHKYTEEEQINAIKNSKSISETAVRRFLSGRQKMYHKGRVYVDSINMVYKMFYPYLAKLMTKKIVINKDKCVGCKLCEKRCPRAAIKIGEHATINKNCILCQRCMNSCPRGAFIYKDKEYEQYKPVYKEMFK